MSLGSLVLSLQADLARTQEDMGRLNQIVENTMTRVNATALAAQRNIQKVGETKLGRIEGAREAANDMEHVGHAAAGARREMLVIAHELFTGNFKRAAGSVMVLGERMDWLGKLMSPTGLAIGAAAAALLGLAAAAYKGAEESAKFADSLKLTGNYAGITEGQYNELARRVATASGSTVSSAREVTQALISTGRFGSQSLSSVSTAAELMAQVTGQKGEDVVKEFEKMSGGALKWAMELNKQVHFVDGDLFEHVKALEDAGRQQEAMATVADALSKHLASQGDNVGWLTGLYRYLKSAVDGAKQSMLDLGRTPTAEEESGKAQQRIDVMQDVNRQMGIVAQYDRSKGGAGDLLAQAVEAGRRALRAQENQLLNEQKVAHSDQVAEDKNFHLEWIKTHKEGDALMQQEIEEVTKRFTNAGYAKDIPAAIAQIRKSFQHGGSGSALEHADLTAQTKPLQDQINAEEKLLAFRERTLDEYHKRNLISDKGYYDTSATVIEAYNKRIESLYDEQIAAVEKQASKTADAARRKTLETQADTLRTDKQNALMRSSELMSQVTDRQTESALRYREEIEKLNAEIGKLTHTQGETAGAEFDRTHAATAKQAALNGNTGDLDTLAKARELAVAQARMNELREQAKTITEQLTVQEQTLTLAVTTGAKTSIEAALVLSDDRKQALAQLTAIQEKMQAIADSSSVPQLQLQSQQFGLQVKQLAANTDVLGKSVTGVFADSFAKMLDNTITRTKTLRQEFLDMAASIEQAISQIVARDLANALFGQGGTGDSGSGLIGQLVGFALGLMGGGGAPADSVTSDQLSAPDWSTSPGRASGGPVTSGGMYEVNERGPELLNVANKTYLMMGGQSGTVTPASAGRAGNSWNLNISVPPGSTRQSAQQQAGEIMRQAQIAFGRNN